MLLRVITLTNLNSSLFSVCNEKDILATFCSSIDTSQSLQQHPITIALKFAIRQKEQREIFSQHSPEFDCKWTNSLDFKLSSSQGWKHGGNTNQFLYLFDLFM